MNRKSAFPGFDLDAASLQKNQFKYLPLQGMDLRDYFAAKAMQGLLSTVKDETWFQDEVASICYEMADKMMKAREQ